MPAIQQVPALAFRPYSKEMPFDPNRWLDAVPDNCSTRGMFFQNIQSALEARGCDPIDGNWLAFKRYSFRDYYAVLLKAARRYCPEDPVAQGLYELGHVVYPNFVNTMVGRAIFAVAGMNMEKLIKVSPRAFEAANSHGKCIVHKTTKTSAHWSFNGIWDFHPFSIGIARGAFEAVNATDVDLLYFSHAPNHIEFRATWKNASD